MEKIKFEIKSLEKKPEEKEPFDRAQGKPETPLEIEGGKVALEKTANIDKKINRTAARKERRKRKKLREKGETLGKRTGLIESLDKEWVDIMKENKEMLSEHGQVLFDNLLSGNLLKEKVAERSKLYKERKKLFKKLFGVTFGIWDGLKNSYKNFKQSPAQKGGFKKLLNSFPPEEIINLKIDIPEEITNDKKANTKRVGTDEVLDLGTSKQKTKIKHKEQRLRELGAKKTDIMARLHKAIKDLDAGEPIEEFRDENRRIVYYDEDEKAYFTEEGGNKKYLGVGDIVSDYAWGIKYVPDGEMVEPSYRIIAKRILVNETRRDLEKIHNDELVTQNPSWSGAAYSFSILWSRLKEYWGKKEGKERKIDVVANVEQSIKNVSGWVAEAAIREFLSRIAFNKNLNFVVSRASVEEDAEFKYDFKIRVKRRTRGIDVESKNIKSVGYQLKIYRGWESPHSEEYPAGKKVLVDEVIKLSVPSKEFRGAIRNWFEAGEPSGGPEQFLSPELKKAILKAVTEKLVDIPQEVFDKIE